jgi:hypothetical protein
LDAETKKLGGAITFTFVARLVPVTWKLCGNEEPLLSEVKLRAVLLAESVGTGAFPVNPTVWVVAPVEDTLMEMLLKVPGVVGLKFTYTLVVAKLPFVGVNSRLEENCPVGLVETSKLAGAFTTTFEERFDPVTANDCALEVPPTNEMNGDKVAVTTIVGTRPVPETAMF